MDSLSGAGVINDHTSALMSSDVRFVRCFRAMLRSSGEWRECIFSACRLRRPHTLPTTEPGKSLQFCNYFAQAM